MARWPVATSREVTAISDLRLATGASIFTKGNPLMMQFDPRYEQMLSVSQCANSLGVQPRTIREMIKRGDLPAYRLGNSNWRIRPIDVLEALRPREANSNGR